MDNYIVKTTAFRDMPIMLSAQGLSYLECFIR